MPPAAEAAPEPEAGEQRPGGAGLAHLGLRGPLLVFGQLLRDNGLFPRVLGGSTDRIRQLHFV